MITFFGFIGGVTMMVIGFFTIWKTQWFIRNFGDLGQAVGAVGATWLSWKLFGVIFLFLGFFFAFGLFSTIFGGLLNSLFSFGP